MKELRYICAQPAVKYYTWQVEVMINNFIRMGINPNNMDILLGYKDVIADDWKLLQSKYSNVRFFFYSDDRENKSYIPSIYFYLMKRHLQEHAYLENQVLFIHDSDIVFTKQVDYSSMIDDDIWYLSDTNSYINYDYIQQKGDGVYKEMCNIIGLDYEIPKLNNLHSGGAQYIVKNTTTDFWDKVERDSVELYRFFCKDEPNYIKKHDGDYPIQKWTAGMWSFLWNGWLAGNQTIVDKRLDFGWVTNPYSDVEKYSILHNAGVTHTSKGLFYKGNYINELPYNKPLQIDETKASFFYWKEIESTSKITILK